MEKEAEKFLQAEETAEKLVESLKQLYRETTSYQTATKELDVVRQQLLNLIDSTEKVVNGSHEVVRILKEIGGPEILSKLREVEYKVSKESLMVSKSVEDLKTKFSEKTAQARYEVSNEFAKQWEGVEKLKMLVVATLASSIIAVIVGIIALLR